MEFSIANGLKVECPVDHDESLCEFKLGVKESERRLSFTSGRNSMGSSGALFASSAPGPVVLHSSPSGKFLAIHWPTTMSYIIVELSSDLKNMTEVDRGQCSELAWVGPDNHVLLCKPGHILTERTSSKRFSIFGKAEKDIRNWVDPSFVLKQCAESTSSSFASSTVRDCDLPLDSWPGTANSTVDLFSGFVLCQNYSAAKPVSSPDITVIDATNYLPSKSSLFPSTFSRFFCLHTADDNTMSFAPLTPISTAVIDVCWDYGRAYCATLSASGSINILRWKHNTLSAFATLDSGVPSGLHFLRWTEGVLLEETARGVQSHFVLTNSKKNSDQDDVTVTTIWA
jgi:hypothetical protein